MHISIKTFFYKNSAQVTNPTWCHLGPIPCAQKQGILGKCWICNMGQQFNPSWCDIIHNQNLLLNIALYVHFVWLILIHVVLNNFLSTSSNLGECLGHQLGNYCWTITEIQVLLLWDCWGWEKSGTSRTRKSRRRKNDNRWEIGLKTSSNLC